MASVKGATKTATVPVVVQHVDNTVVEDQRAALKFTTAIESRTIYQTSQSLFERA